MLCCANSKTVWCEFTRVIGVATYTASTAMAVPHFGPRSSHQLWHNSQINSSVTNIITDNRSLAATTSNRLTGLLNSHLKQQLSSLPAFFVQPATFRTCLIRGVVNILGGGTKNFAREVCRTKSDLLATPLS